MDRDGVEITIPEVNEDEDMIVNTHISFGQDICYNDDIDKDIGLRHRRKDRNEISNTTNQRGKEGEAARGQARASSGRTGSHASVQTQGCKCH